jgi:integrase
MSLTKFRRGRIWYLRGTVRGQPVYETTGTEKEAAAEAIRIKRENQLLDRSVFGEQATRTFAEAALSYLEFRTGLNPRDEAWLLRIVDHFGTSRPLGAITSDAIDSAVTKLCPKAGPAYANRSVITPIAAVLHHAAEKGWMEWRRIKRRKPPRGKTRWLTRDEAERLIAACAGHLRPLVVFMLYTGARVGEALDLDWRNVDLVRRRAVFVDTKNEESRGVPLHGRAFEALANLPMAKEGRRGRVFRRPDGKPYAPKDDGGGQIKTAFSAACRRAGLAVITRYRTLPNGKRKPVWKASATPHDLRHTWATWLYAECRDLRVLMELGGWKTISMVARYAHVNPDHLSPAIESLPGAKSVQPVASG